MKSFEPGVARGKELDECQLMVLMKYFDGESDDMESYLAERILEEHPEAAAQFTAWDQVGLMVRGWNDEFAGFSAPAAIPAAVPSTSPHIYAPQICSPRTVDYPRSAATPATGGQWWSNFDWLFGLGWATSGALVAASITLMVVAKDEGMVLSSARKVEGPMASYVNQTEPVTANASAALSDLNRAGPHRAVSNGLPDGKVSERDLLSKDGDKSHRYGDEADGAGPLLILKNSGR